MIELDTDGLPCSVDAERFVLGAILLDSTQFIAAAGEILPEDFSLETHRRIFRRMADLNDRGAAIDRVTLAEELGRNRELQSCGGFTYLVSLDEGLPSHPAVSAYVGIIKDKSVLRQICVASDRLRESACDSTAVSAEILSRASASFLEMATDGEKTTLQSPRAIIEQVGGVEVYLDRKARATGLRTGYSSLDSMTGGMKAGALYILAARPAMGKTALALNIAERVVRNSGKQALVFSLEMEKRELLDRLICSAARVDTRKFDAGKMDRDERGRVAAAVADLCGEDRILIDDRAATNLHEIHAKVRKAQVRGDVGLVVVDYLQLLIDGKAEHRVAETSMISRGLKLIAKDCKLPVLALSQLSRETEKRSDPRPKLSDLRDSGSIEQDADVVAFLFREEVYKKGREDLRGLAELIIEKQRGGPIGAIPLVWFEDIVRFEERAIE